MLYTQADRAQATAALRRRRLVVIVHTALLVALSIASFVWFRLHRDVGGWIWTGLLSVVAGAYFLFFYEVYLRPVRLYKRHVDCMLDGRTRETIGWLKAVDATPQTKDGLDWFSVLITIGQADEPKDDRQFDWDALKGAPDLPIGTRVRVLSSDRRIASLEPLPKES